MENLQKAAHDAGFDGIGVTTASPLEHMKPILEQAKDEGRYPDFVEQDVDRRINPRSVLENAVSVIAVAVAYKTVEPGPTPPLHGTVSRSAWGLDYHRELEKRMDQLIIFLKEHYHAKACVKAVDTSPLIDRAIAIESGLGIPGDNCAVYVPPFGSWVFLGEILVDAVLPLGTTSSVPTKTCVECQACIKACPTQALYAPGKIKPQRCISYLTQKSGQIPLEFRETIKNSLWGCDICQQACPQNQSAKVSRHREFRPIVGPHIPLIPLLSLSNKEFKDMFGPTSMAWRGKNTVQRNACIILGNQGHPEAVEPLRQCAASHPSDTVREAANWALRKIESRK